MRASLLSLGGVLFIGLILSSPVQAHLSIIRQGLESRGAIEAGDRHGQALAAGDFNGDGFDDLAMGAPNENVGAIGDAGAVVVEWGGPYGLDPGGAQIWTEDDANGGGGVTAGGQFGYSLVAADFNGDGFDDLAIGSPGCDAGVAADAGIVYVLRGTSGGLVRWLDLIQSDGGAAVEGGDRFGFSLAVGNFDGDSHPYPDLAVGSPGENNFSGAVFWFLSNAVGPVGASGHFTQADFGETPAADDRFGFSLAAGNIISTSHDDLAVGAPFRLVISSSNAGVVYQIAGGAAGLSAGSYGILSALDSGSLQVDGRYGYALAIGSVEDTGSSYQSLVVGEPWRDLAGKQRAGRVMVYKGNTNGVQTIGEIILDQDAAGGNVEAWDEFGAYLTAGRFWDPADGWDDLAVGSPGDGLGFTSSAGQVNIFHGGPTGPGDYGWSGFNQGTLNEIVESGDALGHSPVFGYFDGTGFGNLAVGAPGENNDSGMVHIIAPWRQTYGLSCRHSVVYDCDDQLYFSQKPYDRVLIASTTKILTVLIACEMVQAGQIALTDEYTVPEWVAYEIGGSQVPLWAYEKINFWDLMNVCIHLSGNDAAHALADWMMGGGGPMISMPLFALAMNDRAALIGMANSHFNNPNGFEQEAVGPDLGDHYSTPVDMALLSQVAMDNPLFRSIVDATKFSMVRQITNPFSPGTYISVPFEIPTFYAGIILNNIEPAIGIKGGWTPAAQGTGCYAAETTLGDKWVAGTYYTHELVPWGTFRENAGNLLLLGGSSPACRVFDVSIGQTLYVPKWVGFKAAAGTHAGGASEIGWGKAEDMIVEIGPWYAGSDETLAHVDLTRVSEALIADGEEVPYGISPFHGHGDITLLNGGSEDVSVEVHLSYNGGPLLLELIPGEPQTVAAYEPREPLVEFTMLIMNVSPGGADADITVEEVYPFDLAFAPASSDKFSVLLQRFSEGSIRDSFSFLAEGQSIDPNASMYMSVYPVSSETSAVPETITGTGSVTVLQLQPSYPNPFGAETQIRFDLHQESRVGVMIYDVRGRLVRRFEDSSYLPGRHHVVWDGCDTKGLRVADGVYFLRVNVDGKLTSGRKITLVK